MWQVEGMSSRFLTGAPFAFGVMCLVLLSWLLGRPAAAENARRFPSLPLLLNVAEIEGEAVVDQAWLDERVKWSDEVFGKHGVTFEVVRRRSLAEKHAKLETRSDRHALGALVEDKVVNCFIVKSLRDVDDPGVRYRQGVHWRPQGYPEKHFVVVSSIAGMTVLAHELGHFFGNRRHSKTPGNLMSYTRGDGDPFFDAAQIKILHRHVRRFLRSGELVPAASFGKRRRVRR
jgi:hypothetical protein